MASVVAVVADSSVAFPSSEPSPKPVAHLRPTYLPFRRISLPTPPSLMHRQSVVSVASFDSLPEEESSPQSPITPVLIRNVNPAKKNRERGRPGSSDGQKRNRRRETSNKPKDTANETKRRKIIHEFYQTEQAYVDGLELIYSHFLTPIIASLDSSQPLLDRAILNTVFSNFIDIWNLHRSFFSALSSLMFPNPSSTMLTDQPLSPVLLSHFPYLSLYTPFITAFPTTITAILGLITPPSPNRPNPHYNEAFASFVTTQEADPRCGRLKLRDWLLTIVQRCPRYLLLLKDLIECTDAEDPEHEQLTAVHTLVSKITLSLNTSLHTHAQTLSLLALQRATPNLPFQLITPGRTLLKRGPLMQVERSEQPREREFLLFSDCLVWLASEDLERAERGWAGLWSSPPPSASPAPPQNTSDDSISGLPGDKKLLPNSCEAGGGPQQRPPMIRTRSKSEAELFVVHAKQAAFIEGVTNANNNNNNRSNPSSPMRTKSAIPPPSSRRSYQHPAPSNLLRRQASNDGRGGGGGGAGAGLGDENMKWVYKGRSSLVDLEIIVTPPREPGEERRCEILSPEGSFVLYATSETERDDWVVTIRQAKAQLMVSLNVTNPNSTLTSSASTNHIRRALQALPFPPNDERNGSISEIKPKKKKGKEKEKDRDKDKKVKGKRGRVEHWVPAIWIPDEKAQGCMRCGRSFGWRRRRHHCRLCGRCVCASCSDRTFFIADPNNKDKPTNPARACTACYETVFPLLDPRQDEEELIPASAVSTATVDTTHTNSISSLTNFPSWLSMPSLPLSPPTPDALMYLDSKPGNKRSLPPIDDNDDNDEGGDGEVEEDEEELLQRQEQAKRDRLRPLRASNSSRPRSYIQILEDFQEFGGGGGTGLESPQNRSQLTLSPSPVIEGDGPGEDGEGVFADDATTVSSSSKRHTIVDLSVGGGRVEDTARRNKRFSLPAVALQTTSVTATTQQAGVETLKRMQSPSGGSSSSSSPGRKRFSLVLSGRHHHHHHHHNQHHHGHGHSPKQSKTHSEMTRKESDIVEEATMEELVRNSADLSKGVAANKLSELLGRGKKIHV